MTEPGYWNLIPVSRLRNSILKFFPELYDSAVRKRASIQVEESWHERLRAALRDKGWSVPELARRMGHPDDQPFIDRLYSYTQGKVKNPRGEMLEDIARALGITEIYLRYAGHADPEFNVSSGGENSIKTLGEVAAGIW